MKKVSFEYGCPALGYTKGEIFVEENMTDDEIRAKIEDVSDFYIGFTAEDGYEPVLETVYRKRQ